MKITTREASERVYCCQLEQYQQQQKVKEKNPDKYAEVGAAIVLHDKIGAAAAAAARGSSAIDEFKVWLRRRGSSNLRCP